MKFGTATHRTKLQGTYLVPRPRIPCCVYSQVRATGSLIALAKAIARNEEMQMSGVTGTIISSDLGTSWTRPWYSWRLLEIFTSGKHLNITYRIGNIGKISAQ